MEQDQEQRNVCRRCSKSFLSGRVLRGHMRCHMKQKDVKADGENGYALRENPTKSWKSKDDHANPEQEHECKVCGKGFESLRALFGHMRHHSKKRKKGGFCKECGESFQSLKALAAHIECQYEEHKIFDKSDCENLSSVVRRKRSKRTRCMNGQSSSLCPLNEHEQEIAEVAVSLMLLSGGVRDFDETVPVTESTENSSVIFYEAIGTKKVHSVSEDSLTVSDEKKFHDNPLLCDEQLVQNQWSFV